MLSLGVLEWVGAIGGGAGALLLAFNNRWSGYGFVLFLASNAAWMTYGVMTHTFGMVTMQIVCTGTSLLGIWRWLVKPGAQMSRGMMPSTGPACTKASRPVEMPSPTMLAMVSSKRRFQAEAPATSFSCSSFSSSSESWCGR